MLEWRPREKRMVIDADKTPADEDDESSGNTASRNIGTQRNTCTKQIKSEDKVVELDQWNTDSTNGHLTCLNISRISDPATKQKGTQRIQRYSNSDGGVQESNIHRTFSWYNQGDQVYQSQLSNLYCIKSRWKIPQDVGLSKFELDYVVSPLQDGRPGRAETIDKIRRLYHNLGFERNIPLYSCQQVASAIFQILIPGKKVQLYGSTIRMEEKPIIIQLNACSSNQCDQKIMEYQDLHIYGRYDSNGQIQRVFESQNIRYILISSRFCLATFSEKMHNIPKGNLLVLRLAVQFDDNGDKNDYLQSENVECKTKDLVTNSFCYINCLNLRARILNCRNQFPQVSILSNLAIDEFIKQSEIGSSDKVYMKWQCQTKQIHFGQSTYNPEMEHDLAEKQAGILECRSVAEGMILGIQQLMRISCNFSIFETTELSFLVQMKTKCLLLQIGNSTAEYCIRHWRAASIIVHFMRQIHITLKELGIAKVTVHIPGKENTQADVLSRLSWRGVFKVNPEILQPALASVGNYPTLDDFAHRMAKQCARNCSPLEDHRAVARNAFTIPWKDEILFLHPPIGQTLRAIQEFKGDQTVAALILPKWALYKYQAMLPPIQNRMTLGLSQQILLEDGIRSDKYAEGESLYRSHASQSGLYGNAIDELIKATTFEKWRKRRYGLTLLANYMKVETNNVSIFMVDEPVVELINALTLVKSNGEPKYRQKFKNMRKRSCATLQQFSKIPDISKSSLIKAFSKGLLLQITAKAIYPTIWIQQILIDNIQKNRPTNIDQKQQVAMALVEAFCAAWMTELVLMKESEMILDKDQISIETKTSKGGGIKLNHTIVFIKREGQICPE
ncbi:MAG: hypothetical protein EZS28_016015 [Streblomastix strix]|uniref:Uncharacterized protein n=1 Tax=Streblomastix strix TaxID=222440 RepID=A0A5J4W0V0_9EUKA|nr:MAG: hypothetical protein EZS28_016015 [Streblomastix strix]